MRTRLLIVALVAMIAIPLGVGVVIEARERDGEPPPRATGHPLIHTGTPLSTVHPGFNVTPPVDRHLCDDGECLDLTGTEFCGEFSMCTLSLEGDEVKKTEGERAAFAAKFLAYLRSHPDCPAGYDTNKAEFASVRCIDRVHPEQGPPAPPPGSKPLEFPAEGVPGGNTRPRNNQEFLPAEGLRLPRFVT